MAVMMKKEDMELFRGKKILVTGHTGFKGAWLSELLLLFGAEVTGYALEPPTQPSLFRLLALEKRMNSVKGDVRDLDRLMKVFHETQPDYVIHLAAQPLVRESYRDPVGTYATNVMGTVNICEAVRHSASVLSFLNVTTDKVYMNTERAEGYREDEPLDGYDPYSNSKSCSELVTHSYIRSFFREQGIAVSTARAGNVIGGGDFAADRIIPDAVRAVLAGVPVQVRNPNSVRPYQHVLEPLGVYLEILLRQAQDIRYAGYYNVGPDDEDSLTTGELAERFTKAYGDGASWVTGNPDGPHEANFLRLSNQKIRETFGWKPVWNVNRAVEETAAWTKVYRETLLVTEEEQEKAIREETDREILSWLGNRIKRGDTIEELEQ